MQLDWDWFFSSLSQSAAAIVGLFGAFIITKVLSNQALYLSKCNRIQDLLTSAEKVRDDAASLNVRWYNELTNEYELEQINQLLDKEEVAEDSEALYAHLDFSHYSKKATVLSAIDKMLERRRRRLEREEEKRRARASHTFIGIVQPLAYMRPMSLSTASLTHPWEKLNKKHAEIEAVTRDARHQIRTINDFLETIKGNPESSPLISISLVLVTLLFYTGVIAPLAFMPTLGAPEIEFGWKAFSIMWLTLKGGLLVTVSLIFTMAPIMFMRMNSSLRYPEDAVEKLKSYTSLSAYSKYFAIKEDLINELRSSTAATAIADDVDDEISLPKEKDEEDD